MAARMAQSLRAPWFVAKRSVLAFIAGDPFRLAAALSYYTLLSMAPLLLIVLGVGGFFFAETAVRMELVGQVRNLVGSPGADVVDSIITNAQQSQQSATSILLGGALMLFGATTVFAQLQGALNQIWQVKAEPTYAVLGFLRHRLLSFALVLAIGFLLTVSLTISAVLSGIQAYLGSLEIASVTLWQVANGVISFTFVTVLIAMLFKYLPDALIEWRDVWLGAVLTSILFLIGKYVIGLYLGQASIGSIFGAAGSVVVLMVWVYYAALILFFGAEVTRAVAQYRGARVRPSPHAARAEDA
jgi:membrane protein